jgi:hypothetical protein
MPVISFISPTEQGEDWIARLSMVHLVIALPQETYARARRCCQIIQCRKKTQLCHAQRLGRGPVRRDNEEALEHNTSTCSALEISNRGQARISHMQQHLLHSGVLSFGGLLLLGLSTSFAVAGCRDGARAGVDWTDCSKGNLMLGKSNLAGAVLTSTRLTSTDLSGSNLSGAKLQGAELSFVRLRERTSRVLTSRGPQAGEPPSRVPTCDERASTARNSAGRTLQGHSSSKRA